MVLPIRDLLYNGSIHAIGELTADVANDGCWPVLPQVTKPVGVSTTLLRGGAS
jgi:hypothetical protein